MKISFDIVFVRFSFLSVSRTNICDYDVRRVCSGGGGGGGGGSGSSFYFQRIIQQQKK